MSRVSRGKFVRRALAIVHYLRTHEITPDPRRRRARAWAELEELLRGLERPFSLSDLPDVPLRRKPPPIPKKL